MVLSYACEKCETLALHFRSSQSFFLSSTFSFQYLITIVNQFFLPSHSLLHAVTLSGTEFPKQLLRNLQSHMRASFLTYASFWPKMSKPVSHKLEIDHCRLDKQHYNVPTRKARKIPSNFISCEHWPRPIRLKLKVHIIVTVDSSWVESPSLQFPCTFHGN